MHAKSSAGNLPLARQLCVHLSRPRIPIRLVTLSIVDSAVSVVTVALQPDLRHDEITNVSDVEAIAKLKSAVIALMSKTAEIVEADLFELTFRAIGTACSQGVSSASES